MKPDRQSWPPRVPSPRLDSSRAASAVATGKFCAVTAAESVAVLRPHFIGLAMTLGLTDLDAAALKDARPRALTQAIASHIFATGDFQGVQFSSRHGDDQKLWAIFEEPGDPPISPLLDQIVDYELQTDSPDILEAFRLLGLVWEDD